MKNLRQIAKQKLLPATLTGEVVILQTTVRNLSMYTMLVSNIFSFLKEQVIYQFIFQQLVFDCGLIAKQSQVLVYKEDRLQR